MKKQSNMIVRLDCQTGEGQSKVLEVSPPEARLTSPIGFNLQTQGRSVCIKDIPIGSQRNTSDIILSPTKNFPLVLIVYPNKCH